MRYIGSASQEVVPAGEQSVGPAGGLCPFPGKRSAAEGEGEDRDGNLALLLVTLLPTVNMRRIAIASRVELKAWRRREDFPDTGVHGERRSSDSRDLGHHFSNPDNDFFLTPLALFAISVVSV